MRQRILVKAFALILPVLSPVITAQAQEEGTVPGFVIPQARETLERFLEWKNGEETVVFPILTDLHSNGRESYRHIGYLAQTDRLWGYDFMANLGDIGLNLSPSGQNRAYSRQILMNTKLEMGKFNGVFLYAAGNHDWDGGEGKHLDSAYLSDLFQKPSQRIAAGNLHIVEGTCYGWYDVPGKHVRVIFLNSEGTETVGQNYYTYDSKQLEWLVSILNHTAGGTDIVLLSHYMPHPIGRWTSVKDAVRPTCEILVHLLQAFSGRQKGGELDVQWDFRKAEGRLVGLFCGDTHCNDFIKDGGVNFFITQGYGGVSESEKLPGQKHADFSYEESLCVDVIAIKLKSKQVHTFRIGAGGKDMDYEFSF